jgi:hypothetical protein
MLSEPSPIPLAEVSLDPEEVRLLAYFSRDLQEMTDSAFMKDGPGKIQSSTGPMLSPTSRPKLITAVTDDEIRSFVTIFRRLYMTGAHDPASFVKVVPIFVKAMGGHPYGKWVEGAAKAHQERLTSVIDPMPVIPAGTCTFTTKRLIDVFLYTQYAHQPNEDRQRQFTDCLQQVNNKRDLLTWLFLTEMYHCAGRMACVGRVISGWFKAYCDYHGVQPDVLNSLRHDLSGLGADEKQEDREDRLFREQVENLATVLWEQAGQPAGGPGQFFAEAHDQLGRALGNK